MKENAQAKIKELITKGKEQGYLTYAEVNDHLPDGIIDSCLLYTSDAADDSLRVDLGGRRIIKK